MTKILIIINNMNVGGIQKSLLELLKALANQEKYDISLFCSVPTGEYLKQVPQNIHILAENPYARIAEQDLENCKTQGLRYFILRLFFTAWSKLFGKGLPTKILCRKIGTIGHTYDLAISYSQPIGDHAFCNLTNEIVLDCCCAKRKITFLHCDFGSNGGNTKRNRKLYHRFDAIAAVSDSVGRRFSQIIPDLANRVFTVCNFCDINEILRLSEINPVEYSNPCIVTVARLSQEKGLLRCVPLFARLRDEGVAFEWHIVGSGSLFNALQDAIAAYRLSNNIMLEGEQINPYRYMKNADYFLLPSFHEAAPMVFDEAMCLGIPVLTTDTLSARELVTQRNIGRVCKNEENAIYKMLYEALTTKGANLFQKIKPNQEICLQQFDIIVNGRGD